MANFVKDIQKEFGTMKLEQLHPNEGQIKGVPRNPRTITEEEFKKLKKSLKNFRKMLYLRPMVVDEDFNILGGNMRYRALVKLAEEHAKIGAFEFTDDIPDEWVKQDCTLTEKEKREFILKDNKERGEPDWDIIANEWDTTEMQEWDIIANDEEPDVLDADQKEKPFIVKITFENDKQLQDFLVKYQTQLKDEYNSTISISGGEL